MSTVPWLTIVGAVPLVGALVVAALPRDAAPDDGPRARAGLRADRSERRRRGRARRQDGRVRRAAPVTRCWTTRTTTPTVGRRRTCWPSRSPSRVSLVTLVAAIVMSFAVQDQRQRFQFVQNYDWIKDFGVHYAVGVDGIGLALIDLTAILMPIVVLGGRGARTSSAGAASGGYLALLLGVEGFLIGVVRRDRRLPVLRALRGHAHPDVLPHRQLRRERGLGARRSYAAVKFLLYTLFGGLLMLAAVIGLYVFAGHSFLHRRPRACTPARMSHGKQDVLFLGFFIAFAIKAPLWPFHTWLPDAAAEVPTSGAVMLVGVLDKVGTFGFIRWTAAAVPLGVAHVRAAGALAGGGRHLLRRAARDRPARPQAAGLLHLGLALRVHRDRHLRVHLAGRLRRDALHGQPRLLDRRAVPHRRLPHRPPRRSQIADFGGVHAVAPWLSGAFLVAGLSASRCPACDASSASSSSWSARSPATAGSRSSRPSASSSPRSTSCMVYQRTMQGPLNETRQGLQGPQLA